jgi:ribose transport system substrate-binding protein
MNKWIVLMCVSSLLLAGCEGESAPEGDDGEARLTIGVSVPAADHGWTAGIGWWAKQAMAAYPEVNWVYATASNPEKQVGDIRDMMVQDVDGLVVLATESAPLTPVAKQAKQRGIFLVNVDRGFLEPVADIFIEGDNKAFGRKSAQFMAEKLGGEGKIVILRGIPSTVDTDRYAAAMEVFNEYPGIEVLASQPGMWNRQKSLEVMQSYLVSHPQIDAVWAADDDMALGAEQAIREAGRTDEMWILGGAGMKEIVHRVGENDPLYPADITYPPAMIAAGIHVAVAELRGEGAAAAIDAIPDHLHVTREQLSVTPADDGQRHIKLDVFLITPENASAYYFPDSVY